MRTNRLVLMIVAPCFVVVGSRAVSDEKPPKAPGSERRRRASSTSKLARTKTFKSWRSALARSFWTNARRKTGCTSKW